LSLLRLAEELGDVSKACKLMGYHRDMFYEVKRAFAQSDNIGVRRRLRSKISLSRSLNQN
jgi:hypothetical protein